MNEFEQLGSLLLGQEKTRIDRLEKRLNNTQQRCQDIVTILPAALRAISEADLIAVLEIPVESCLKKSVQNPGIIYNCRVFYRKTEWKVNHSWLA